MTEIDPNAREPEPGNERDGASAVTKPSGRSRRRRGRRRRSGGGGQGAQGGQNGQGAPGTPGNGTPATSGNGATSARALGDSLLAAVQRHTSAAVLARGRGYVKRKRVVEVRVSAGRIRARVLGSGGARYRVELASPEQPAPAVVSKIRWSCDCPYAAEHRRGTCKHVIATAIVGAQKLTRTESLRRRWLGQPSANAAEAEPAEFDALAERMLAAFTAEPVSVEAVLERAMSIAPPPFDVPAR